MSDMSPWPHLTPLLTEKTILFMKLFAALTLLCININATAQTFTQRLQRPVAGKGTVTVVHSAAIDKLVNGNQPDIKPTKPTDNNGSADNVTKLSPKNTSENSKPSPDKKETTKKNAVPQEDSTKKQTDNEFDIPTVDMRKKVMGRSYKVNGYRVQAFAGGNTRADRQKAQNIGEAIKLKFPEQPIYVHFYSPRWICRIGNFRTYEVAHAMLLEIKKMGYKQASIVKGKISVQY